VLELLSYSPHLYHFINRLIASGIGLLGAVLLGENAEAHASQLTIRV